MKLCAVAILFYGLVAVASAGLTGRIVGGTDAPDGAYPYQGFLLRDNSFGCGASIINKHWMLTAAHCVRGLDVISTNTAVVVGTNNKITGGDMYTVESFISHPEFKYPYPGISPINDIALLRISDEIIFNENVQPIALPKNELESYEDKVATLTGWGSLKWSGIHPDVLQQINLTVHNLDDCRKTWFSKGVILLDSNICTFTKQGEGACHGDSGGPLVVNGTQVGIVSFGWPCATGYPDVFTRVSSFIDWINKYTTL